MEKRIASARERVECIRDRLEYLEIVAGQVENYLEAVEETRHIRTVEVQALVEKRLLKIESEARESDHALRLHKTEVGQTVQLLNKTLETVEDQLSRPTAQLIDAANGITASLDAALNIDVEHLSELPEARRGMAAMAKISASSEPTPSCRRPMVQVLQTAWIVHWFVMTCLAAFCCGARMVCEYR